MQECTRQIFYLNGHFHTCEAFRDDYLYRGQSVYEVMRVTEGVPLFFEDHMERLVSSARLSGMKAWHTAGEIREVLEELIGRNQDENGNVKVVFNHQPAGSRNFLAYFTPACYPDAEQYSLGVGTMLYMAERQNPTAKLMNTALRLEVYKAIIEKGVYEAFLVNRQGYVLEGSRSNVFFIRGKELYTAPDELVLNGISRKHILDFLERHSISLRKEPVHLDELGNMDAVFLTGTSPGVLPVSRIDKYAYETGNTSLSMIMDAYGKLVKKYIDTNSR